jgi:ATP-dependent protease ClpP protease subunit
VKIPGDLMVAVQARLAARNALPRPALPRGRGQYRIENHDDGTATMYLLDEIGYWGIMAADFVPQIHAVKAQKITLHINSPGGDVFDGVAIYNALLDHPADIAVKVDGLAASAASFIAQAGDTICMNRASQMMIHDASGLCIGNAADMAEMVDLLDRVSGTIAGIYADRAGGTTEQWRDRMRAETWYSADEAVEAGLADEVAGKADDQQQAPAASWDLSIFAFAGRQHAPAPVIETEPPAPDPAPAPSLPVFDPAAFAEAVKEALSA